MRCPLVLAFAALACRSPQASEQPAATRDGAHDFDFEIGTWRTQLRRLANPLSGDARWIEYTGTTTVRKVWEGRANLVELVVEGAAGRIEALSLRLYDPPTRRWSLNFATSRSGALSPPSIGSFRGGRGEFYGEEMLGGRPIRVRFVISDITPTSVRFQQAFSADAGKTWEVNWIAHDTRITEGSATMCCPILELRQYTLRPGQRDTLIELFDREFVEPLEASGMRVVGQFRDGARPDRFVWIRGFADMTARAQALAAFYGGPTWKAHRDAANATMIDSDNVLLLRPVATGFTLPAQRDRQDAASPYAVAIYYFKERLTPALVERFDRALPPGGVRFVTEYSANTFPQLPVREGEHAFVVFGAAAGPIPAQHAELARAPEVLALTPTLRSLLR